MDAFDPQAAAFRFYEDDGSPSESASTAIAAQDTNVIRDASGTDDQLHLRYRVDEVGGGSIGGASTDDYSLEFRLNGGGGWSALTASSTEVQSDTASQLSDGSATTNRSTDGISDGSGSFVAGEQEDQNGTVEDHELTADNFTEHVWALDLISANLASGDFIDFRMRINGGAMDNAVTPRITIAAFNPDADKWRFYEDGTESGSSAIAAEDTDLTSRNVDSDSQVHIRWRVQELDGVSGATDDEWKLRLSYNLGAFGTISASDPQVRPDTTSGLTDAGATTNRGTEGISDGTGSFVAGEQEEGNGVIETHQLTASNFTEHVWAMTLQSAGLSDGDTLDFQIALNNADVSSVVPRITVSKGAPATVVQDVIMGPGIIPFAR